MENNNQDFYWESPCIKCKYKKDSESVSGWTVLLVLMFAITFCTTIYFWGKSQSLENKLANSVYISENGDLHRVEDGKDTSLLDVSDFYENINEFLDSFY